MIRIIFTLLFIGIFLTSLSQDDNATSFGSNEEIPFSLEGRIYFYEKISSLPKKLDTADAAGAIHTNKLDIPNTYFKDGFPGVSKNSANFVIDYHGFFYINENQEGKYEFELTSDDGSKLIIDDTLVISHDKIHPFTSKTGTINLKQGIHKMNVQYFQGLAFNLGLQLKFRINSEDAFEIFDFNDHMPVKLQRTSKLTTNVKFLALESFLLFDYDSCRLESKYYPILDEVYKSYIEGNDAKVLVVEGHTDTLGSKEYNDTLSLQRTEHVSAYLNTKFDIKGKVLEIGFGKSKCKYPNDNEENRHKNRRVEIKIMDREEAEKYVAAMSSHYTTVRK